MILSLYFSVIYNCDLEGITCLFNRNYDLTWQQTSGAQAINGNPYKPRNDHSTKTNRGITKHISLRIYFTVLVYQPEL